MSLTSVCAHTRTIVANRVSGKFSKAAATDIRVYFHVIINDAQGNIPQGLQLCLPAAFNGLFKMTGQSAARFKS
jgi:hypothetical protein